MQEQTHIAILDDHRMFLEGLAMMVGDGADGFDVRAFSEPLELIETIENGAVFDLIICDLIMNQMNGLAFVAAARSHTKDIPILMLSGINTRPPYEEMRRLGANGFIHKSSNNSELLNAINRVLSGEVYFDTKGIDAETSPIRADDSKSQTDMPVIPSLANRQIEVLRMIEQGASNKEISRLLSISENTVKTHLRQIFTELGVNKRTACVRRAQVLGII